MTRQFKKKVENFKCENCGAEVSGNGYTNHCPACLFSKHVDVFPGDRLDTCCGLMEPRRAEESGGEWSIVHFCLKCGQKRKNKVSKGDDFDKIIKISATLDR